MGLFSYNGNPHYELTIVLLPAADASIGTPGCPGSPGCCSSGTAIGLQWTYIPLSSIIVGRSFDD